MNVNDQVKRMERRIEAEPNLRLREEMRRELNKTIKQMEDYKS